MQGARPDAISRDEGSAVELARRSVGGQGGHELESAVRVNKIQQGAGSPIHRVRAGIQRELLVRVTRHCEKVLIRGLQEAVKKDRRSQVRIYLVV